GLLDELHRGGEQRRDLAGGNSVGVLRVEARHIRIEGLDQLRIRDGMGLDIEPRGGDDGVWHGCGPVLLGSSARKRCVPCYWVDSTSGYRVARPDSAAFAECLIL